MWLKLIAIILATNAAFAGKLYALYEWISVFFFAVNLNWNLIAGYLVSFAFHFSIQFFTRIFNKITKSNIKCYSSNIQYLFSSFIKEKNIATKQNWKWTDISLFSLFFLVEYFPYLLSTLLLHMLAVMNKNIILISNLFVFFFLLLFVIPIFFIINTISIDYCHKVQVLLVHIVTTFYELLLQFSFDCFCVMLLVQFKLYDLMMMKAMRTFDYIANPIQY